MGYGGANESMWTNSAQYFSRVMREDSIFGKECLRLKSVCWMNPYAVIEHIPASWDEIEICIYHVYEEGFRMNNKLEIKILPMSKIEDTFEPIWDCKWPLKQKSL